MNGVLRSPNKEQLHWIHLKINYSIARGHLANRTNVQSLANKESVKNCWENTANVMPSNDAIRQKNHFLFAVLWLKNNFCGSKTKFFKSHQMEFQKLSTKADCSGKLTASGTLLLNFFSACLLCMKTIKQSDHYTEEKQNSAQLGLVEEIPNNCVLYIEKKTQYITILTNVRIKIRLTCKNAAFILTQIKDSINTLRFVRRLGNVCAELLNLKFSSSFFCCVAFHKTPIKIFIFI